MIRRGVPGDFAGVVLLMARSDLHRNWFVSDLLRLVVPPLGNGQSVVRYSGSRLTGFASWAFLSREASDGLASGARKIQPDDWSSGSHVWLVDVVSPEVNPSDLVAAMKGEASRLGVAAIRFNRSAKSRRNVILRVSHA